MANRSAAGIRWGEEGILILKPAQQTAVVESAPAEALGEPASLVA
jgi:hypothetical protein